MEVFLNEDYISWIGDQVGKPYWYNGQTYNRLLSVLGSVEFYPRMRMDGARASDAIQLRSRYFTKTLDSYTDQPDTQPCSILEMMAALAIRCESDIMDRPCGESRVPIWFWSMIHSMGLAKMDDMSPSFKRDDIVLAAERVNCRSYSQNGKGGLFTLRNPPTDMRGVDIWCQMMWWLNEYLELNKE